MCQWQGCTLTFTGSKQQVGILSSASSSMSLPVFIYSTFAFVGSVNLRAKTPIRHLMQWWGGLFTGPQLPPQCSVTMLQIWSRTSSMVWEWSAHLKNNPVQTTQKIKSHLRLIYRRLQNIFTHNRPSEIPWEKQGKIPSYDTSEEFSLPGHWQHKRHTWHLSQDQQGLKNNISNYAYVNM